MFFSICILSQRRNALCEIANEILLPFDWLLFGFICYLFACCGCRDKKLESRCDRLLFHPIIQVKVAIELKRFSR